MSTSTLSRQEQTDEYDRLSRTPEFSELRRHYRRFAVPATVIFLAWYLLYVVMSMFAGDFMGTRIVGNINVALVFGLLQFITTFAIAALYSRHSALYLDPLAHDLQEQARQEGLR